MISSSTTLYNSIRSEERELTVENKILGNLNQNDFYSFI